MTGSKTRKLDVADCSGYDTPVTAKPGSLSQFKNDKSLIIVSNSQVSQKVSSALIA